MRSWESRELGTTRCSATSSTIADAYDHDPLTVMRLRRERDRRRRERLEGRRADPGLGDRAAAGRRVAIPRVVGSGAWGAIVGWR